MANYKFYNIGAANARIAELETEVASLKAAAPDKVLEGNLSEAVASNEDISAKLTAALAEVESLKSANGNLASENAALINGNTEVSNALNAACVEFGVADEAGVKEISTVEKIAALKKSVVKAVASVGVSTEKIPASGANDAGEKTVTRAQFTSLSPKEQMAFCKRGGKIQD